MNIILKINKASRTPVYRQIVNSVLARIEEGSLSIGSPLPSINRLAGDYNLARETVVKAFKVLQEQGIISPVHGKAYFVSSLQIQVENRIFVMFDTFSAYKEVIYNAIKDTTGEDTVLDIYFHHYNFNVFEKTIADSIGRYHSYIVIPIENDRLDDVLSALPADKLYLLDIKPASSSLEHWGIFQNFGEDIFQALTSVIGLSLKYHKLILVFRNQITDPPVEIVNGFNRFCELNHFKSLVIRTSVLGRKPEKGEAYIVIDDEDLVYLAEQVKTSGLQLGSDLGLISYNETPLKKIAANGISVISTDFAEMGRQIVKMVNDKQKDIKFNRFRFIDRKSF